MEKVLYCAIYAFVFIVGICIGSFLNVLIWRIPQKMNFVSDRSICPSCNVQIKNYDLIPILSYIILGGRCRNCHEKISIRYPILEAITGVLFVIVFVRFGYSLQFLLAVFVTSILIVITMIDFDIMEIPNGLVIALILPAVLSIFLFPEYGILNRVIGFFEISLPMFLLILFIPNAFGGGDVKLIAVCGFLLGWQNTLLAAFIAILMGGCYGIFLLIRKTNTKKSIAFGPYLCVGIFTALLYGERIIDFYLNIAYR